MVDAHVFRSVLANNMLTKYATATCVHCLHCIFIKEIYESGNTAMLGYRTCTSVFSLLFPKYVLTSICTGTAQMLYNDIGTSKTCFSKIDICASILSAK